MRNFIAVVLLTTSITAAPRLLSPERPVGDATLMENSLSTGPIDIAAGGDSILAAWSDVRSGTHRDIYATRLGANGEALDPNGIPVDVSPIDKQLVRVIWDGERYLFLWKSGTSAGISTMIGISKTLLTGVSGTVDLAPHLLVSSSLGHVAISLLDDQLNVVRTTVIDDQGSGARLVQSGNATFVVWQRDRSLLAQRIENGVPSGLVLQLGTVSSENVPIVTAPSLVAWADLRTVHVLGLQPNGVFEPRATYSAPGIESIASTADGGFIAVAVRQLRRFDASGNFVDQLELGSFYTPRLATAQGNVIGVAIGSGSRPVSYVYGARETRNLSWIAPVQTMPRLATDGTNALLVWKEELPSNRLMAQLVSASGQPLHDALTLSSVYEGEVPAVGFDGSTYVVIRTTPMTGHIDLVAQRIARDGTLDGAAFLVASSQAKISHVTIAGNTVAWLDEGFTLPHMRWTTLESRTPLLWNPADDIAAASDGSDVIVAASTPVCGLSIASMQGLPTVVTNDCIDQGMAIAGDGDRWLVVYSDGPRLWGRYLQHDGSPIGEPLLISDDTPADPRVAWDGDAFDVTWKTHGFVQIATVRDRDVEQQLIPFLEGTQENGDIVFVRGSALLAYAHTARDAAYSSRVFTRTLSRPRMRPVR